jgi:nuclear pore complex protein Nup155
VWDGLDQIIVSVGLVRPKPNVFVASVRYLLVLTTPVEVVVLAVSFAGDDVDGEMILQPTALSVPSDDVNLLQVVGTPAGRIFMCGNDGNLYELDYQSSGGWFSKACRKRNLTQSVFSTYLPFLSRLYNTDPIQELRFDSSRNILYALTSSSCIHGYWLGSDGSGLVHFASRSSLQSDPSVQARVYGTGAEIKIVSIFPVTSTESGRVHLIALASSGVRLYFTTTPSYSDKPYALQVLHVDYPLRDMRNRTCRVDRKCFFEQFEIFSKKKKKKKKKKKGTSVVLFFRVSGDGCGCAARH